MRYIIAIIIVFCCVQLGNAQTYEIGGMLGGSNYIGDIGRTNYIAPKSLAFGGIAKWNRSARHSFRASFLLAPIIGNDFDSGETRRKQRGYEFENTILEASLGLEYTFWDFNMYSGQPQTTPYLYTGLTYFFHQDLVRLPDNSFIKYESAGSVAIPMVVGIKTTVGTRFVLGFEVGARYTFTDNLDGSFPDIELPNDREGPKFGNLNSDDWYVFTGITFTVTFGRQPCYCNF